MGKHIAAITLLVPDYDDAISYYVGSLDFHLVEDTKMSPSKRWVLISPSGESGCNILLAKADSEKQLNSIGEQTGDRVFLFLHTDDFDNDYNRFKKNGVSFLEEPRDETYGKVVVFQDVFGNKWDLIEPKNS